MTDWYRAELGDSRYLEAAPVLVSLGIPSVAAAVHERADTADAVDDALTRIELAA